MVYSWTEDNARIRTHPPYSQYPAPCDFFVPAFVKYKLRGIRFQTPEVAIRVFEIEISAITLEMWQYCFD